MCKNLCISLFITLFVFSITTVVLASPEVSSNNRVTTGFMLSIDRGGPGSQAVESGDYARAIKKASKFRRHTKSLSAQLSLCSAWIGLGEYTQAQKPCDLAVELAEASIVTARNPKGMKDRNALAKAYSNRGVLHQLAGQTQAAAQDFSKALQQGRSQSVVLHNLAVQLPPAMTASTK